MTKKELMEALYQAPDDAEIMVELSTDDGTRVNDGDTLNIDPEESGGWRNDFGAYVLIVPVGD